MNLDELNHAIVEFLENNGSKNLNNEVDDFEDGRFDALWRVHLAITRNDIKHLFPYPAKLLEQ